MQVKGNLEYTIIIPATDWQQLESKGIEGALPLCGGSALNLNIGIGIAIGHELCRTGQDKSYDGISTPFSVRFFGEQSYAQCSILITPQAYVYGLQNNKVLQGNRYFGGSGRIRIRAKTGMMDDYIPDDVEKISLNK